MSHSLPESPQQTPLHPLKFRPRLVPKMWGGRRLETLGKVLPDQGRFGESWEIYDFPPGVVDGSSDWVSATVAEGPLAGRTLHELLMTMPGRLLGRVPSLATPAGPQFPLLIKFLDAEQALSVQVHPDEAWAASHPGAHLKNEAWCVLDHKPGARLLKGVVSGTTREAFEQALVDGTVEQLLVSIPARPGDVHHLPSGTVHALGAGMLVAEVQTPSDTTYRVYDFGRVDPATGSQRQLHVAEALQIIDFSGGGGEAPQQRDAAGGDGVLLRAPEFVISRWSASAGTRTPLMAGIPSILLVLSGHGQILGEEFDSSRFVRGDTILLPADLEGPQLHPEAACQWLEVRFGRSR